MDTLRVKPHKDIEEWSALPGGDLPRTATAVRVKIHYRDDKVRAMYKAKGGIKTDGSAGFDLIAVDDVDIRLDGVVKLIDLGVIIKLPPGFHSILMPRSSTNKKWGIKQANSVGLIDNDYCGEGDYIKFAAMKDKDNWVRIKAGTPIAQLVIHRTVGIYDVEEFIPGEDTRGGFGSTDVSVTELDRMAEGINE